MATPIYTSKNVKCIFTQHILKKNDDGRYPTGKYEAALVIDKSDKQTVDAIEKGIKDEIAAYLEKNKLKKVPDDYNYPLKDGDKLYAKDQEKVEEGEKDEEWLRKQAYKKGVYILNTASKNPPQVIDTKKQPVTDLNYNVVGQWALSLSYYKVSSENQGITTYLNGVRVVENGSQIDVTGGFDLDGDDESFLD
jgi:HD superfamily phosphohydrolase